MNDNIVESTSHVNEDEPPTLEGADGIMDDDLLHFFDRNDSYS